MGQKKTLTTNKNIKIHRPNKIWKIDLIGRIYDENGEKYFILVAIYHYKKWFEAKFFENKSVKTLLKTIKELLIEKNGIPKTIFTDNGKEFINSHIDILINEYRLNWQVNSPGHHKKWGWLKGKNKLCSTK